MQIIALLLVALSLPNRFYVVVVVTAAAESNDSSVDLPEIEVEAITATNEYINRSFASNPFSRWESEGITKEMVNCCGVQLIAKKAVYRKKVALLEISQNGKRVDIQVFSTKYKPEPHDVINYRMEAMKRGVIMAIKYAKASLGIVNFPYVYALLYPLDDAEILRRASSRCYCYLKPLTIRKRSDYVACSTSKQNSGGETNCNIITSWPPFLAQNRRNVTDNLFVLTPDFSYFSTFNYGGDHGTRNDIWFRALDKELLFEADTLTNTAYFPAEFAMKKYQEAVWRGTIDHRMWKDVRHLLSTCYLPHWVNSRGRFISREDMCKYYQLLISVPGNGVWSWATKFNLVIIYINIYHFYFIFHEDNSILFYSVM